MEKVRYTINGNHQSKIEYDTLKYDFHGNGDVKDLKINSRFTRKKSHKGINVGNHDYQINNNCNNNYIPLIGKIVNNF